MAAPFSISVTNPGVDTYRTNDNGGAEVVEAVYKRATVRKL